MLFVILYHFYAIHTDIRLYTADYAVGSNDISCVRILFIHKFNILLSHYNSEKQYEYQEKG
jgi:hypothetical protein